MRPVGQVCDAAPARTALSPLCLPPRHHTLMPGYATMPHALAPAPMLHKRGPSAKRLPSVWRAACASLFLGDRRRLKYNMSVGNSKDTPP
eukprot:scaffold48193_cov38-Tisochrysis_lutea.AAC.1